MAFAARDYAPGIGQAVADRTINRKITETHIKPKRRRFKLPRIDDVALEDQLAAWAKSKGYRWEGEYKVTHGDGKTVQGYILSTGRIRSERWGEVAERVARGNVLLLRDYLERKKEFGAELTEHEARMLAHEEDRLRFHLAHANTLLSGRHLQHGDETQPSRNMEVYTNCLDGSTRILTMEYGPVEIGKIAGEVVTVIAGDGRPRKARINAHGVQELYEITFRPVAGGGGKFRHTVKATADHRWILRDGSVTTSLSVGDVLAAAKGDVGIDPASVVHGLIFGDGTAHKSRRDAGRTAVSQGRTYASIRVCKQDAVQAEICEWLDAAGYTYTTPEHAKGDRVYYVGKMAYAKEMPFTRDPEYIAGFIYGWWLADGHKGLEHALEISTASEEAAAWLEEHAGYAGFNVTMHRVMERKPGDGAFANGKALHVLRLRKNVEWKVESIESIGEAPVFCPEEPVTSSFVLANGLLTGNCSTSAVSHLLFYLLLNGSGVGRAYDDDMMVVDWRNAPTIVPVIDMNHPDAQSGEIEVMDLRTAQHLYADQEQIVFEVPDSREGWAKAIEMMETLAWEGVHKDKVLLLDFSKVRERGAPIGGMQGRPASGPGPLMKAIEKIARIPFTMMAPWRQAMFIDHFLAECVLVGGARRAARMATKYWKDATVFDFIALKRGGFLWSSNNSVVTDGEFWDLVHAVRGWLRDDVKAVDAVDSAIIAKFGDLACHAWRVFNAVMDAAYNDMTGEPGFINGHKLTANDNDLEQYLDGKFAESERYSQETATHRMMAELARIVIDKPYRYITNPCGEIVLFVLGGYCVIGDVVPYHAADLDQAEEAFRVTTRALMRTNLMNSLYQKEVARTNRIGVSMTGVHEFALAHFGYGWKDIVNEEKSKDFWLTLSRFKRAVKDEARRYADFLGVVVPHTDTTIKPAGTTSKLFGLSEGAHLPAMREYLRWVQFRNDDPLVKTYEDMGYPVKRLRTYSGTTVVGFPTRPTICTIEGADEKVVTASEATMAEQFEYLRLLEKYWIVGVEEDGVTPLSDTGNQVSYTLKYDPQVVSFEAFKEAIIDNQPTVRCCSVMPKVDMTAFEYQPEEPVTKAAYEKIAEAIANDDDEGVAEDIGLEHVGCAGGACPIDFNSEEAA